MTYQAQFPDKLELNVQYIWIQAYNGCGKRDVHNIVGFFIYREIDSFIDFCAHCIPMTCLFLWNCFALHASFKVILKVVDFEQKVGAAVGNKPFCKLKTSVFVNTILHATCDLIMNTMFVQNIHSLTCIGFFYVNKSYKICWYY